MVIFKGSINGNIDNNKLVIISMTFVSGKSINHSFCC